jgi:hypothetical protein
MNVKSVRKITTNRQTYSSIKSGNIPAFVIYFGIVKEGTKYNREVYDTLSFFGNVGGFVELLRLVS